MDRQAHRAKKLFETVSLGAPEKAVGFVLWRVVHRYMREVDRALLPLGLTHLQFTTLALAGWLRRESERVTSSAIAEFGDIHPMQVSYMLKSLENKKLITRRRSPSDVRAKYIEVTAAGFDALRRAMPLAIDVQRRLFGDESKKGGALLAILLGLEQTSSQEE